MVIARLQVAVRVEPRRSSAKENRRGPMLALAAPMFGGFTALPRNLERNGKYEVIMSKGRVILWCIVSMFVALGAVTWALTRDGMSARETFNPAVDHLLARVRMSAVQADVQPRRNPLIDDADAWREGGREFQRDCAMCHGADGKGNGRIGTRLYPPAPDLTGDTQQMSDAALYHVIANGIRLTGMPAWAEGHDDDHEIWTFVAFVRHLPQLTDQELHNLQQAASTESPESPESPESANTR